jgi:hypothetical protein
MPIVKKALIEYFAHDIPVETTINECTNIFDFQIITSAGDMYKSTFHLVDGEYLPIQKVNRVYATVDTKYGKVYKLKEGGNYEKFGTLPEHCIIDNDNQLTIDKVDKAFYIELAKKRINDYLGIKPEKKGRKKMSESKATVKNVHQKLMTARLKYLNSNIEKSGKNMHLAFKYYELNDIVPPATKIFEEVGLIPLVSFESDRAIMQICNTENPEDSVFFCTPLVTLAENKGTNAVQAFGATITYYRRYLYMLALDVCEPDEFDAGTNQNPTTTPSAPTTTKPLTNADGNASEIQIKQLKDVLKKLRESDPSQHEYIAQIALDTKSFTTISKAECERLTKEISEKINKGEQ